MGMIGRKRRADLVIRNDREIDQKAEDPSAEKVPKAHRGQEHHCPEVRERSLRLRSLLGTQLEKTPGFKGKYRKRDHFGSREKCAQRHMHRWSAGKVKMMHRANDTASRVKQHVEVNHGECHPLAYDSQQHKNVGNHYRGKQLKKVFYPQVYHPESPKIRAGKMGARMRQQTYAVENGDRKGREEE